MSSIVDPDLFVCVIMLATDFEMVHELLAFATFNVIISFYLWRKKVFIGMLLSRIVIIKLKTVVMTNIIRT